MITSLDVRGRIPRTSTGRPKHDRLKEIDLLLGRYVFEEKNLDIINREVSVFVEKYGHEGNFCLKKNRR